ncbi:hypothetical protein [Vibrio variabilis]|uniref:hypothetical protein n=1 Tax=Vibrio variabilis TaxID=990271 RepID=UPI000DDA9D7A|nr:hypothetical protein [Vibrio variabilis]
MKKTVLALAALLAFEATAAYMPSPTMAQGDRIRVRGQSGVEIDATYQPDMTIQMGALLVVMRIKTIGTTATTEIMTGTAMKTLSMCKR